MKLTERDQGNIDCHYCHVYDSIFDHLQGLGQQIGLVQVLEDSQLYGVAVFV